VKKYVELYMDWFAHRRVERHFQLFSRGFYSVISRESIAIFTEDELDVVVSGEEA
jgi:hypothetical protein